GANADDSMISSTGVASAWDSVMILLLDPAKTHGGRRFQSASGATWRYICSSWALCGTSMDFVADKKLQLLQRRYRFRSRRSVQGAMELRARRSSWFMR